jgi:hypothetical protein
MALQTTLENLRAKPEHVRKRIAFWTSFGVTAVIFMFWLASFSITGTPAQGVVASAVEKAGAPGSSLIAGVGSFFIDVKEMIFGTKKVTYTEVEVRPGER